MHEKKDVLFFAEDEINHIGGIVRLFNKDGLSDSFDFYYAQTRDEALTQIMGLESGLVYLANCMLYRGLQRRPSQSAYDVIKSSPSLRADRRVAAAVEVVMMARDKGLVVILGDVATRDERERFEGIGVKVLDMLTQDAFEHYSVMLKELGLTSN